jgi:hypothetical protein
VRRPGGVNVCIYKPTRVILPVTQADHYQYHWDLRGASSVIKLTNVAGGQG